MNLTPTGPKLDALLTPISAQAPAGTALRGTAVFHAIVRARQADDASLPMGQMPHELKRADWPAVQRLCTEVLSGQSKDLQLAVWLLEAQMQTQGLAGIAPGLQLCAALLDGFWEHLHPQDHIHRANLLRWVNRALLPTLKLINLHADAHTGYAWADLEMAQRLEQLRASGKAGELPPAEAGLDMASLQQRLASTSTALCQGQLHALVEALQALEKLRQVVDERLLEDPPSLAQFAAVIQAMQAWFATELRRRGAPPLPVVLAPEPVAAPVTAAVSATSPMQAAAQAHASRDQAYAMLAEACEALLRIEPHSPVPYVVKRAIAWGSLNTAELYQELFLRAGGQLHIFELLGITAPQAASSQGE